MAVSADRIELRTLSSAGQRATNQVTGAATFRGVDLEAGVLLDIETKAWL